MDDNYGYPYFRKPYFTMTVPAKTTNRCHIACVCLLYIVASITASPKNAQANHPLYGGFHSHEGIPIAGWFSSGMMMRFGVAHSGFSPSDQKACENHPRFLVGFATLNEHLCSLCPFLLLGFYQSSWLLGYDHDHANPGFFFIPP